MKLKLQVVKCGRCGKPRGLTHTCRGRSNRRATAKLAPRARVTSKCSSCGKSMTNALTHVCVVKRSAPKRAPAKPAAKKPPRVKVTRPAAPKKATHRYQACPDGDCARVPCLAWREAWREAWDEAYGEGRADGFREGRSEGYAAGYADGTAVASQ